MKALFVLLALLALSQGGAAQQPPQSTAQHVVFISIDGFAGFHLANPALELPNIRALAALGVSSTRSETVFPSMTHPAHTTLITGTTPRDHGVVNNRVVDRRTGQRFHITNLPRKTSIKVPTLFDALKAAGRTSAAFFWPETKDDPSIDDNFAEVFDEREMADRAAISPKLLSELRDAGVPVDSFFSFYDDPLAQGAADMALTKAAIHVLQKRKPALLAVHLLAADKAQHEFGPQHYLSHAALTTADHCVGLLREAVAAAGLADRTTFVITADHGFVTVAHETNVAPLLREPALEGRVRWSADGWYVWGERLPSFDPSRDSAALDRVLERVAASPDIARVVRERDFAALGYPDYDANPYVPGQMLIAGTLGTHLVLDEGAPAGRRPRKRPYHGHGYFPSDPSMHGALVLSGAGVARGRSLDARNVDVAPTVAALLGVSLPSATGRPLREILVAAPTPDR